MNEKFTDYITAEEYMGFRKAVGWAEFPLEEAEEGLKNSFICCLRQDDKPIALGRVIWDHGYVVYIADVIVLPEYQGKGVGRQIINTLEKDEYFTRAKRIEIPASITGVPFYLKMGYNYKNGITEPDEEHIIRMEKFS